MTEATLTSVAKSWPWGSQIDDKCYRKVLANICQTSMIENLFSKNNSDNTELIQGLVPTTL